jgi:hypothetical protein
MSAVGGFLAFLAFRFVYHAVVPSPGGRFALDLLFIAGVVVYLVFQHHKEQKAKKAQQSDDSKTP